MVNDDSIRPDELSAEGGTALPDKEVMSLLDLNADLDLALDAAAPIDLAVGANANIAAPIDASVGANVLSDGSTAVAHTVQAAEIHQGITGDATATADQDSSIDQGAQPDSTAPATADPAAAAPAAAAPAAAGAGGALDGNLLNVNVDLDGDLNLAAPVDGAVAANANVAAPIDASVSANVGSVDSTASGVAEQSALIDQQITGDATATGTQQSDIDQP